MPYLPRKLWRAPIHGGYPLVFVTHVQEEGYPEQAVRELGQLREEQRL